MHAFTHVKADRRDKPGLTARTEYNDGMIEHDGHVGKLLKALDDLGIADNTIVLYTTDNGPHKNTWPDGAISPFRNEKNTNWEGAFRVPCMIRWPGKIKAGSVSQRDRQRARLAADVPRRGRRAGRQGEAAQGARGGRQEVQGPPRRLQPVAVPDRAGREEPAARVLLLQRRRRPGLPAVRELEGRVHGAAGARHPAGVGRAVHAAAAAEALRPARRPVRAGRHHVATPTTTG